jgi:CheY-like chemotaxis protein
LLIDDNELVARSIAILLEDQYEVVIECAAKRALELIREDGFEIILCDLSMPLISGSELYERVLEDNPEEASRMIFMTGGAFDETSQRFLDDSPQPWLTKPFDHAELREAIERIHQEMADRSR